ncbi:hypothetical protein BSF38_03494 [Paludisphaera borealis]|uniref:Uncharacterized protein n=1 Tax=Paludisphaera borealis TaxID=1387353 RepID=A0A1U7CSQ5_9BACT|nr:hypothetical protein BSF38_03494 [Paludisphaera borealis]
MRHPRSRFSMRTMLLITAIFALGLFVVEEFWDGIPPRFVVRGIPARINRLRRGMTWEQTRDILGLERSWLRGGTNASLRDSEGNGHYMYQTYNVRSPRIVMEMASEGGSPSSAHGLLHVQGADPSELRHEGADELGTG